MKILLFGRGLLGQALFDVFTKNGDKVTCLTHDECDVCDVEKVSAHINNEKPDFVVNATGYTQVDKAEQEKDQAFKVNDEAVQNLANALKNTQIPLVHFSTDYVFDGKNPQGYNEDASPAPLSVYGASKAEGENAIIKTLKNYYLIRTAWLYGPGGRNFVDTMVQLAGKSAGKPLNVVNDQIGSPTYSLDLAEAVLRLLKAKKYGIYHIVNSGTCSWYEFATEIFNQLGIPQKVSPISSEELARPAPRPKCSILLNTKLPGLRGWEEALADYLSNKTLVL